MAETSNENKDLRTFYNYLRDGYKMKDLPDYTTFSGDMLNSENRERIYKKLQKGKVKNLPSFDDFSAKIGFPIPVTPMYGTDGKGGFAGQSIQDLNQQIASTTPPPEQKQEVAAPVQQSETKSQTENAQTSPRGKGLIFNDAPQEGFTPYNERMEQKTAPINQTMQESANAKQIAEEAGNEWALRKEDFGKNSDLYKTTKAQLEKEIEEYEKAKAEYEAKYPQDWQPKTRAEQMQKQRDADVINAQSNLLNAKSQALNEEADKLNKEAVELNQHEYEIQSNSSLRAQTLKGNVSDLANDVRNEIESARQQQIDARGGLRVPRGGIASLGGSMRTSADPTINHERENEQTKFGIADRILTRVQNRINQSESEAADEANNLNGMAQYFKNYWHGAVDAVKDGAGFDFGIQDAAEMAFLYNAINKSDAIDKAVEKKAKGEKLTPEESNLLKKGLSKADKAMLDAASMEVAAQIFETGWGYTGGQVGVQMLPFILEIAVNPLATAGKSAGSGVLRYAMKKYGAKGFKGAVARGISKVNPTLVSKVAEIGTDLTVGGVGQAVTTGAANTYADYTHRKIGKIKPKFDDLGNVSFGSHEGGMSDGKALASAIVGQSFEYSTENESEWFEGLGGSILNLATRGLTKGKDQGKFAKTIQKAMDAYAKMNSNGIGKVLAKVRKAGHIGGPFEEYTEEFTNNVFNGILDAITDNTDSFGFTKVPNKDGDGYEWISVKKDANGKVLRDDNGNPIPGIFNIGDNVETLLSVTVPQVFQWLLGGASHVGRRGLNFVRQHKYNNAYIDADTEASKAFSGVSFGEENVGVWDAVKNNIDNASQEDLAKEVTSLIMGDNFNADQKIAVLNYAKALQAKRAEDLAETKLTEYKYDTDPDYQELSHRVNVTDNTIQSATTTDGDVIYLKTSDLESGSAMVYNPMTGEEMQIPSDRIVEMSEPLDVNEEADKIEQARDTAETLDINDSAIINGANYTIVDKTPETGMPIAQIENPDGSVETREMTNEEVMAMSQQMQNAIADEEENNSLSPIEKMQKAINSGNAELLNVGMEELQTKIENTNDAKSLAELESMVARFGNDIVAQFKPIFKQKHKELDGEVSSESNTEEVETEEPSQKSRLQEIRDLVSTIGSEEELDNISIDDTLTDEEKQIASNIIEKRRTELRGMAENAPEIASVGSNGIEGNNVPQEQENAPTSENNGIEKEQTPTIPIKDGEKMYESVSADVTLADLMADFDNDADAVLSLVNEHIGDIEGRKPKSMSARVAKQKSLKYWQGVRDLLNKSNEQTSVEEVETESVSEEPVATKESVEGSTQEEQTPVKEKVPDFSVDKAEDARERGYRMVNGERVDRQNPIENAVLGNTTETHFSTKDKVEGRVAVVDASMLQPSHTAQGKNPAHFLPEAQPKNRASGDSQSNSDLIAQNMNPALITETSTAFNGAPVVNSRGEVIQGNNRVIGLQKMHSGYAESAAKYKQYLLDNVDRFGLDRAAIEKMENPVLVNMVDVDDAEAIRLGQFDSHDMESGSGEVFKAKQTLTKMGSEKMQSFLNILLDDHGNPDMAIGEMVRRNAPTVIEWLAKNNFITQQQAANCYNNGALNTSATDALREMLNLQLFEGGIDNLDVMFDTLPSAAQGAIMSIMARDNMVGTDKSLKPYIQLAIEAYHVAMQDEKFTEIGKDLNGAFSYLLSFANQTELFGEGTTLDPEKFDTFALRLAAMFKTMNKVSLRNALNEYYDLVLGKSSGNLFEDNENAEPMSVSEAIEKVFGVKSPVLSKTNNNNNNEDTELSGSNVRNDGYEQSEEGGQGSSSNVGRSEQDSQGERRSDSGRGNEGDRREGQTDEVTETPSEVEDSSEQSTSTNEESEKPTDKTPKELLFTRRKLEDGEECKVERVFRESGAFDFTSGENVESIDDVAYIFKQLETASVENAFVCFVKDGKPTVLHLSMGGFKAADINIPTIKLAYDRLQPDEIYFIHNHPSGALQASKADKDIASRIEDATGKTPTNLIIDTTSGEYGEFNIYDQDFVRDYKDAPDAEIPIKLFSFDKQVFAKDYDPSKNTNASNNVTVAAYISGQRLGERSKLGALILNNNGGIIGNVFIQEPEITKENAQAVADKLYDDIVTFGGFHAVIFGTGKKDANGVSVIKEKLSSGDIRLVDCIDITKDDAGEYSYDSFVERGVMDESTPSDTVETSVEDESTPNTDEITDPRAIVPMPGESYPHLVKRINEAFEAGERLRKDHLNAAKQILEERGEKEAKLIGQISDFIFDRMESAGVQMWFETQESARRGEGQFSMIGFNGLMNSKSWRDVGRLASGVAANVLDKMGVSPLQIKKLTGWEKGAEGKWKYELADIKSFYDDFDVSNTSEVEKVATDASASEEKRNFANAVLEVLLDHNLQQTISFKELAENNETYKELADLYPVLEKLPIVLYYDNTTNLVASTAKDASYIRLNLANYERGSIHHELQHLIQMYEGFAGGASGMDRSSNIQGNGQTVNWNQVARDLQIIIPAWAQNPHGLSLKEALNVYKGRIVGDTMTFEEFFNEFFKKSDYGNYRRSAGEIEAQRVAIRRNLTEEQRRNSLLNEEAIVELFTDYTKLPQNVRIEDVRPSQFHLADGTVYGWAAKDGVHLTMEGIRPETMIHEYGHLWLAGMKNNNPALYESLLRLAKGSAAWNDVVNDPNYADLKTDDEILSEAFCRFSGKKGEQKLIDVTREAIANGVGMKDKAAIAGEYSRLAKKLDKSWEWIAKKLLEIDPSQVDDVMEDVADMLLMDVISGNNPNDGGYTPSGKLKTPKNGNQYFVDKNQYSRGGNATSPSDVANDAYERSQKGFAARFEEAYIDHLRSVRKLQSAIQKETGDEIKDHENVYLHMMHLSSKNKPEQDKVQYRYVEPLTDAMKKILNPIIQEYKSQGMSTQEASSRAMDELEKYLISKHGEERNKVLARRKAKAKAEKEYKERIILAEENLAKAQKDFRAGLINQSELDAVEQALTILKANQLVRENNLYASNRKEDYAGLTETFEQEAKDAGFWDDSLNNGNGGSTATNTQLEKWARDYASEYEGKIDASKVDILWNAINALNGFTLKKLKDSGLISLDTYNTLTTQYKNYVPLQGWNKDTAEDMYEYLDSGKDSFVQPIRKAEGRTTRAGNILATMSAMANSAILAGNKNLAKQKLLYLAQNHKTNLLTVSKSWIVKDAQGNWNPSYPPTTDPADIDAWEKDMKALKATGDAKEVSDKLNLGMIIKKEHEKEHAVRVKLNGKDYIVYINGNNKAALAIKGLLNSDASSDNAFRAINRFRAKNLTSRDPAFLVRNLQKDVISASKTNTVKYGTDYTKDFMKNLSKLLPVTSLLHKDVRDSEHATAQGLTGIYNLVRRYNAEKLDPNNEVDRYFKEFMDNGGHTGYSLTWNVEEVAKNIQDRINRANSLVFNGIAAKESICGVWTLFDKSIEELNSAVEDLARFTTYMTSRQHGRSVLISIADAKDASTNFNKKGSGAMGNRIFRDAFMFFNPAIQSVARDVYRVLDSDIYGLGENSPFKQHQTARAITVSMGVMAALGAGTALLGYLYAVWTGGDDDDEIFGKEGLGNDYWALSTFQRRNRVNIPLISSKHRYVTLNLAQEEQAMYGVGEILMEHILGYGHPDQLMWEIPAQLSKLIPVGGDWDTDSWHTGEDVLKDIGFNIVGSTAVGPLAEVYGNRNFMGGKIYSDYNKGLLKNATESEKMAQSWINEHYGGYTTLFANVAVWEHILSGYAGGLASFPITTFNTLIGDDVDPNKTLGKVFTYSTEQRDMSATRAEYYYYMDNKVNKVESELNRMGITNQAEQAQFVNEHLEDDIDYRYWKAYQNYAKPMNSRKGGVDKDEIMKKAIKDWREIDKE